MNAPDIRTLRLCHTGLTGAGFVSAEDAVSHLGAVQAQDFSAATYALGIRITKSTQDTIEHAYNEGKILRTHIMRPTWHFVHPKNIRWILELTSPNVRKLLRIYNRKLGLDDDTLKKTNTYIIKALEKNSFLTRQELKANLVAKLGRTPDNLALSHMIMWAELDAIIVSGPKRGKLHTYALLDARTPGTIRKNREEALGSLALLYFSSHGPAQRKDFSWWSGLTQKEAAEGIHLCKSELTEISLEDMQYWFVPHGPPARKKSPFAHLLSIYDEYVIAYKDRRALGGQEHMKRLLALGNGLSGVITIDGIIAGHWKRVLGKQSVHITLCPFRPLTAGEHQALDRACREYGTFLNSRPEPDYL